MINSTATLATWRLHLKIEQSRSQYIFNRIYTESIHILISIFIISAFYLLNQNTQNYAFIYFAIGVPVIIAFWLTVFNSGNGKIVESGVTIDEEGFSYIHFGEKETISWDQYDGYIISGSWLRSVFVKSRNTSSIVFSYYTFSSVQRRVIFERLGQKN